MFKKISVKSFSCRYPSSLFFFHFQNARAQENFIIRKINFEGNHTFSAGELSKLMTIHGTSKFSQIIFRKKPILFDEKTLQSDLNRIQKFYQSEGFLNARATYQLQVYQLGFFQSVTIKAMMKEQENAKIPVQILVREAPRLTVKLGYGYDVEENIQVYTDILRLGFLGGARRLNLFIKHLGLEPYNVN